MEHKQLSNSTDIFKSKTYDGHEVTVVAVVGEETARVYVQGGRLANGFATVNKQTAFTALRNCSAYTALEFSNMLK